MSPQYRVMSADGISEHFAEGEPRVDADGALRFIDTNSGMPRSAFAKGTWTRYEAVCDDAVPPRSVPILTDGHFTETCPVKECCGWSGMIGTYPDGTPYNRPCALCFSTGIVPTDSGVDMLWLLSTVFGSDTPPAITERIKVHSEVRRLRVIRDTEAAMGPGPVA